jgi:hypothetical protein
MPTIDPSRLLQLTLGIELVAGTLFSAYVGWFFWLLTTWNRGPAAAAVILVTLGSALISATLLVLIPYLARKELQRHPKADRLRWNITNGLVLLLIGPFLMLVPTLIALWQFYLLYRLRHPPEQPR